MIDEEALRSDMTFGPDDNLSVRDLRVRYEEALRQLEWSAERLNDYRVECERLGWENSELRRDVEKKRLHIDLLVMRMATAAGSA